MLASMNGISNVQTWKMCKMKKRRSKVHSVYCIRFYIRNKRGIWKNGKKRYGLVCSSDATQSIHDEENTSKNYVKAKRKAKFFKRWSYKKKTKYRNDGKRERKGAEKKMQTKRSKMLHRWITMERGKLEGMGMWHNAKARRIVSKN